MPKFLHGRGYSLPRLGVVGRQQQKSLAVGGIGSAELASNLDGAAGAGHGWFDFSVRDLHGYQPIVAVVDIEQELGAVGTGGQ